MEAKAVAETQSEVEVPEVTVQKQNLKQKLQRKMNKIQRNTKTKRKNSMQIL